MVMERTQIVHGQHDAFTWFTKYQLQSVISNGIVPEWFHGILSRKTAEDLLMPKPPGYFLIRVSESRVGYTLSYRSDDRCRHFMIDALEDGQYMILGENRRHRLLQDLVDFHRRTPIMPFNQLLTVACGQSSNDHTDYAELLFPQNHPKPESGVFPNDFVGPTISHLKAQEDIPPALPHRHTTQRNSTVPSTNRLYPNLDDEVLYTSSPLPNKPPELSSRSCSPLKHNQRPESLSSSASEQPNNQSGKHQIAKPSVVTNLKNFKKKFQRKRSIHNDTTYAEIQVPATQTNGSTENDYEEIERDFAFGSALSHSCTDVRMTDDALPQEYLKPPAFAPGY